MNRSSCFNFFYSKDFEFVAATTAERPRLRISHFCWADYPETSSQIFTLGVIDKSPVFGEDSLRFFFLKQPGTVVESNDETS